VTLGADHTVRAWSVATRRLLRVFPTAPGEKPEFLHVDPQQPRFVVMADGRLFLGNLDSGQMAEIGKADSIPAMAASGKYVLSCRLAERSCQVWDLDARSVTGTLPPGAYSRDAWLSPDGQTAITVSQPELMRLGTIHQWSVPDGREGKLLFTFDARGSLCRLSPDGTTAMLIGGGAARIVDLKTGSVTHSVPYTSRPLAALLILGGAAAMVEDLFRQSLIKFGTGDVTTKNDPIHVLVIDEAHALGVCASAW
jgi:WD40 repeat protein